MEIDNAILHVLPILNKMQSDVVADFVPSDSDGGGDILVLEGEMGVEGSVVNWVGEGVLSSELKL